MKGRGVPQLHESINERWKLWEAIKVQGEVLQLQEVLQVGKRDVLIQTLEPVGHYAVKPTFSDGHDSGLFTWEYLAWLGANQESLWQNYLDRLAAAGASRDPA